MQKDFMNSFKRYKILSIVGGAGGGGGHKLTTVNISAGRDVPIKGSHI